MKLKILDVAVIACTILGVILGVAGLITGEKISTLSSIVLSLAFGLLYLGYVKASRK